MSGENRKDEVTAQNIYNPKPVKLDSSDRWTLTGKQGNDSAFLYWSPVLQSWQHFEVGVNGLSWKKILERGHDYQRLFFLQIPCFFYDSTLLFLDGSFANSWRIFCLICLAWDGSFAYYKKRTQGVVWFGFQESPKRSLSSHLSAPPKLSSE